MAETYLNSVNLNQKSDFPYLCMDVQRGRSIPEPPGWLVWHWHEDFQFIYVFEGEMYLHTLEQTMIVPAKNGAFINKNVVHLVLSSPDCHYKSFLFPEHFVSFYPGSPAAKNVERIASCKQMQTFQFTASVDWHREILTLLQELDRISPPSDCYEYEVLVKLTELWLTLAKNLDLPKGERTDEVSNRMRRFLTYIADHLSEDISLDELASAAGVSKSECLRCFKLSMQDTPYHYLIECRLEEASRILKNTDLPVSEVARAVGFNSQSHFGKLFKAKTGFSPIQYRNAFNHSLQ